MVMLISKFHRLIQSKILWGLFLIIIVFTFVVWGTRMPKKASDDSANAAGTLNGKPVSMQEYRKSYLNTYMSAILAIGRRFQITPALDKQISASAWRRLAALRKADELGMEASKEEILATIQSHPGFNRDGRFDQNAYIAFIQRVLAPMGFSEAQFEEHVRQEIILQKLQSMISQAVFVAPYEINRTFSSLTDIFDVEYVQIKLDDIKDEVEVTRDDAYTFYLTDPSQFTIPEQVKVKYVRFPIADYMEDVAVTNEDDALAYYDEFIDSFATTNLVTNTITDINGKGETIEKEIITNKVEYLTFDKVKKEILDKLTLQAASYHAADVATDFVVALTPDREGNAPDFDEAASKIDLEVYKAGPFSLNDELPDIDAGFAFNHTAFNLENNPDDYYSDAVVGSNYVYVIALEERIAPRVPDFDEAEKEIMEAAEQNALVDALAAKAQELQEKAVEAVKADGTFKDVVESFGFTPKDTGEFSVAEGIETNEYSDILVRGILPRNQGEVTDPLPASDAVLIAYIAKRVPGDVTSLQSLRPRIRASVRRERAGVLFEGWEDYLLQEAGFKDNLPDQNADEEDPGDYDDEAYPEDSTNTAVEDTQEEPPEEPPPSEDESSPEW